MYAERISLSMALMLTPSLAWGQQVLEADFFRVTDTPELESTPSLGRDSETDLVVYSSRDANGGNADIQYTRIVDGAPSPRAVTIPGLTFSGGNTDDVLNDIDGDRIVFTAYTDGQAGSVVLFDLATSRQTVLADADQLFEARIFGDQVIWHQKDGAVGRVKLIDLDTGIVRILAESPLVVSVDIDSRFAVYSMIGSDGFADAFAYELATGTTIPLPGQDEASSVVPRTYRDWVTWQVSDLFGNEQIVALNLETDDFRVVAEGPANVFRPTIHDDLIAYETDSFGSDVDVALYRISTGETYALTNLPGDQFLTDVFEARVAYVDSRNSADDIYYANIRFVDPPPPYECPSDSAEDICDLGCSDLVLTGRKLYHPSVWVDGEVCICEPTTFLLPSELAVVAGNAGNHWTDLVFEEDDEQVICRYGGGSVQAHPSGPSQLQKGLRYVFDFCTDGRTAGDPFTTQYIRVFVANGDSDQGTTDVAATLVQNGCSANTIRATSTAVQPIPAPAGGTGCTGATPWLLGLLAIRRRSR